MTGREIKTLLSPAQARQIAERRTHRADAIERLNAEHGNGDAYAR